MTYKRRYLDYEILKAKNEGYELFCEGVGRISSAPQSSLVQAVLRCQRSHPACEVAFRIGAVCSNGTRDWCVIYRPRQEAPGKANGLFAQQGENGVVSEPFGKKAYSAERAEAVSSGCEDDERGR